MIINAKKSKVRISRIILGLLFVVCFSIICKVEPKIGVEPFEAKAETSYGETTMSPYYDIITDNWAYFYKLTKTYINQNPDATSNEIAEYLEDEAIELEQGNIIIPAGSIIGGLDYDEIERKLTDAEKELVVTNPIGAIITYFTGEQARKKTEAYYGDAHTQHNNGDAFRHAYWNALMTKWMGATTAELFATAHESDPNSLAGQMDLSNNATGRNDGATYWHLLGDAFAHKILDRVSDGYYKQVVDQVEEDGVLIGGNLVDTNKVGLRTCEITLVSYDGMEKKIEISYGDKIEVDYAPYREHYEFKGYYDGNTCYVTSVLGKYGDYYEILPESTGKRWYISSEEERADCEFNGTLYAHWERLAANCPITVISLGVGVLETRSVPITSGVTTTLSSDTPTGYKFIRWDINGVDYGDPTVNYTFELHRSYITGEIKIRTKNYSGSAAYSDGYISLYFEKDSNASDECVAAGTLITLADGRQVPVEALTGSETLLVWNLHTGRFDSAPILFIDHDEAAMYRVINLYFSDGTQVKVISEHAFWDFNLNKYVFLREDAGQYIGHWFNKQTTDGFGNMIWTSVQLTNVVVTEEYTTAWSPVTYGHLCIYVNGMLSMPGATTGLINIFEVDSDTMQINQEQYLADIEEYGLFSYEEFAEIYPIPEVIFEAFGGQYLKVSIGKGLIGCETLGGLIETYSEFFE